MEMQKLEPRPARESTPRYAWVTLIETLGPAREPASELLCLLTSYKNRPFGARLPSAVARTPLSPRCAFVREGQALQLPLGLRVRF